jgi:hypothetical protein
LNFINVRGYFARQYIIHETIKKYIEIFEEVQVINLGAGFDTMYWNLNLQKVKYYEIDFPEVVKRKIKIIKENNKLSSFLKNEEYDGEKSLKSDNYNLFSVDLRNINEYQSFLEKFKVNYEYFFK